MWAIAGLGNPGSKYSRTRHNLGFMVVDAVAESLQIIFQEKKDYLLGKGSIMGHDVLLIEPLTFMNNSGSAILDVLRKFSIPSQNLIVIHDDLDMDIGKLKIRKKGSSGGHRGVESIIKSIGTEEFIRIKIGIGRDPSMLSEDYVLKRFKKDELPVIKEAIKKAASAIPVIISEGVEKAMNRFH